MPWVQVFTRESPADRDALSPGEAAIYDDTQIEIGHPSERAHALDWMWFHTLPGDAWAVGGEFDDPTSKVEPCASLR
jgi:hypothetical protein